MSAAGVEDAVTRARDMGLARNQQWLSLLHYRQSWVGPDRSVIDDPQFFLSPRGKRDPGAELEATLRHFYLLSGTQEKPPRLFLARYAWLRGILGLNDLNISIYESETAIIHGTTYHRAELIFPAAYMNNPASMYGHTFLNLHAVSDKPVLARSIDFSAHTTESNGIIFAAKGLLGAYRGRYAFRPYYERIRTYNNISQRDIWEYELNLTQEEIRFMVLHLIELNQSWSRYFFFDENCSFNLLFLLEVARPGLNLTRQFKVMAVPVDTIRAVERAGLIRDRRFRPALATRISWETSRMDAGERRAVGRLSAGGNVALELAGVAPARRALVLDAATHHLQYLNSTGRMDKETYSPRYLGLLKARSRIKAGKDEEPPVPGQPLQGHRSRRAFMGWSQRDGHEYAWLGYRPVYHSLDDFANGKIEGAAVNFFSGTLRYDRAGESLRLQNFDLLDMWSLAPASPFLRTRSFHLSTGLLNMPLPDGDEGIGWHANMGLGHTIKLGRDGLLAGLFDGDMLIQRGFDDQHAIGAGPALVLLNNFNSRIKGTLEARIYRYVFGESFTKSEISSTQSYQLSQDMALSLRESLRRQFGENEAEVGVQLNLFF